MLLPIPRRGIRRRAERPGRAEVTRRRLMLAGERLPLSYDTTASRDTADADAGSHAAGRGSPAGADGHVDGGDLDLGLDRLLGAADTAVGRLGGVAAERIHPDDLGGALKRLRRVRNRLEAVETAWLAQVRNRKTHRADGSSSASTWARDQLGGSKKDAADQIRTADRLVDLPDTTTVVSTIGRPKADAAPGSVPRTCSASSPAGC